MGVEKFMIQILFLQYMIHVVCVDAQHCVGGVKGILEYDVVPHDTHVPVVGGSGQQVHVYPYHQRAISSERV